RCATVLSRASLFLLLALLSHCHSHLSFIILRLAPSSTLLPYTTLFRSPKNFHGVIHHIPACPQYGLVAAGRRDGGTVPALRPGCSLLQPITTRALCSAAKSRFPPHNSAFGAARSGGADPGRPSTPFSGAGSDTSGGPGQGAACPKSTAPLIVRVGRGGNDWVGSVANDRSS